MVTTLSYDKLNSNGLIKSRMKNFTGLLISTAKRVDITIRKSILPVGMDPLIGATLILEATTKARNVHTQKKQNF